MLLLFFSCTYFFTSSSLSYFKMTPSSASVILEENEDQKGDRKVLAAEPEEDEEIVNPREDPEIDHTNDFTAETGQEEPETTDTYPPDESNDALWIPEIIQQLSFLQSPIPGASISSRDSQLPGAPRAYRNGTHEGLDYYNGYCGVPIHFGDPVYAAGAGFVMRVDHDYSELPIPEREEMLRQSAVAGDTPEHILDKLRGRQVWIVHTFGIVTRYAHLETVSETLQSGDWIEAGKFVGTLGNSGTSNGARGTREDAHLHFEIWVDDRYLGEGLSPEEVRLLWEQVLIGN